MIHEICKYCRNCNTCQHFKFDTCKVAGLYATTSTTIAIVIYCTDFVFELPEDDGHTIMMTCINHFSKTVWLVPLWESGTQTVADKFLSTVDIQCRLPLCILSDHDPRLCGHYWDDLVSLVDQKPTFSIALHPQTDGIAQVTNHIIDYLLNTNS